MLAVFKPEFDRARSLAERAVAQLSWPQMRIALDPEANSCCVIMKHVGGNLRSRWTDPFTTDGEKPWRNRDSEFIDDLQTPAQLREIWTAGWTTLDAALASFADADLDRILTIRGEPHTLALALTRSLAHVAYHAGQIVQTARVIASRQGTQWTTLTVQRGGSVAYNRSMGFDADRGEFRARP